MSLLPVLSELLEEVGRSPTDLCDQHFGLTLRPDSSLIPSSVLLSSPLRCGYLRPWRSLAADLSGVSSIQSDPKEFRISLDVQEFKPEELKVQLTPEGYISIEGRHEERSDEHGFVSRQFRRKYKIPKDVDQTALTSSLSSDGVLCLKAPKKTLPEAKTTEIPITQTNTPAVKNKKKSPVDKLEKMEQ